MIINKSVSKTFNADTSGSSNSVVSIEYPFAEGREYCIELKLVNNISTNYSLLQICL